jgi:acetyl-CoA acetyltransferase
MAKTTKTRVAYVGTGYTQPTRRMEIAETALAIQAAKMAIEDAGIDPSVVDGINVSVHHYPRPDTATIAQGIGMTDPKWVREDAGMGARASGVAAQAIESGECNAVMLVKIMNTIAPVSTPQIDPSSGGVAGPTQFEVPYGLGYSSQRVGLFGRRYMHRYGVKQETIGTICVVEREHALLNPWAYNKDGITLEDYMVSRTIAEPVRLLDCDQPVNGAFAFLMTREDIARGLRHKPVFLQAWASAQNEKSDHMRTEQLDGMTRLGEELYRDAGMDPSEMHLWFLYDGFSYFVPLWMENLGLVPRGQAADYIGRGDNIRIGGEHPLNTHGGQLSEGRLHGHGHVLEAIQQLRGTAGVRQMPNAKTAIISSVFPATGAAAIMSAD